MKRPPLTPEQQGWVEEHRWVAFAVANEFPNRLPWIAYEDVVGAGFEGLVRAAQTFDPARGNQFSTYAFWWAKAKIRRFLRGERGRGMAVPENRKEFKRTGELVSSRGGEEWDQGAEVADFRRAETDPALKLWCSPDYAEQRRCLDWRSRVLLYLRTVAAMTLEEVGECMGITRERVRQLEEEAARKLAAFRVRRARRTQPA